MKSYPIVFIVLMAFSFSCNNQPDIYPENNWLIVYPNVVAYDANVMVKNPSREDFRLICFDTKGEIIFEEWGNEVEKVFQIPLYNKPAGYYQIILQIGELTFSENLIKYK